MLVAVCLQAEVQTMSRFPSLTFQLAAARPDSSLIGEATKLHRIKGKELRPYLRWVNKPQHRDPCVLVLAKCGLWLLRCDLSRRLDAVHRAVVGYSVQGTL